MDTQERKQYFRLIFRQTFQYLSVLLVMSLLIGSLLGGGIYMVHALCAAGFVMLCWAWFNYLKLDGMHFFNRKKRQGQKVPYIHRRDKGKKDHRPAFMMNSADHDDDLTSATVAEAENFTDRQAETAAAIARAICGVLLIIASFLIPMQ